MSPTAAVERVFRVEGARVLGALTRALGSLDLAEEALAEALAQALETWPRTGVPDRPGAWITVAARSRALDRVRREATRAPRELEATRVGVLRALPEEPSDVTIRDDVLRLVFACCHPALSPDARIALTTTVVLGLPTADVARSFLVPVPTLQQRLVRAKRKIAGAGIPFAVPGPDQLPERLPAVLAVVEVLLAQGHLAPSGDAPVDLALTAEAVRLADLLVEVMPRDAEVRALRALARIVHARMPARTDEAGGLVLLADQDRTRWDSVTIRSTAQEVGRLVLRGHPGPYLTQALIAATHGLAPSWQETDFATLLRLWDVLVAQRDSPVTRLNRAVIVAQVHGPEAALAAVDVVVSGLPGWHLGHAVRADLLARLDRPAEAVAALQAALGCPCHPAEQRLLRDRLAALAD